MGDPWNEPDTIAAQALLNCLVRELAAPEGEGWRLAGSGRLLSCDRSGRWLRDPAVDGRPVADLEELITLVETEARARTGTENATLADEIRDSRDVVAALVQARRSRPDWAASDLYLRSEQALLAGHRYHPAAKTRGGGPASAWLPFAPEAGASFALELLGVPEGLLREEGVSEEIDKLWGAAAPAGYRVLPVHPWQLRLLGGVPPEPLIRLGRTEETAFATSSLRTVYLPTADLSLKFSLDVRITNDIRRLWARDLCWLVPVDRIVAELPIGRRMLADTGYRAPGFAADGDWEALAVLQREGHGRVLRPGLTPLLAAGVSEGFAGNPLDGLDADRALAWWRSYVQLAAPAALEACFEHGVVLEAHLQNVLVAVDADGMPGEVLFRDHEGVKLVHDHHAALLDAHPGPGNPGVSREKGRDRLFYCLVVNNLMEMAAAVRERAPEAAEELWPTARQVLADWPELTEARYLPAKTNLTLRWTNADGGDSAYLPIPNPLHG
ncbi:IucA/IucC family protein [Streptacidiphilus monticola]|uniref:IucA/IucC family protein n=1 Tax=Streptacidiphilus monticola TaxID=2161674 RepID=A0ABW1G2X8_9ACTN